MKQLPILRRRLCLGCVIFLVSGAPVTAQLTEYSYDELGRLIKSEYNQTETEDYTYDAAGNLQEVTVVAGGDGISFSINDVSVTEGGNLSFSVTKDGSTAVALSVSYATADGTGGSGDYTSTSGVLNFSAAEASKLIIVPTTSDSIYEYNETVVVLLSDPGGGATLADGQGVGIITDDDAAPTFAIGDASANEGSVVSFTVTKAGASERAHNIDYATADNSALAGSDYTSKSGVITFAAGEGSKAINVATINDAADEFDQAFLLNISNVTGGGTISDSQAVGTIIDNDPGPAFSINNVSVSEGGNLVFTVTKSGATEKVHNVNYATANASAIAGSDYTAKSGTLSFSAGQTTRTVTIATIEDSTPESNETMRVNLSAATNTATISDSQGSGTINNDDVPNSPPNAVNDSVSVTLPNSVNVYPLNNDSDPNGHTITLVSHTPGPGLATTWFPAQKRMWIEPLLTGGRYIDYTISDGHGGTDTARINVNVSGGGGGGGGLPLF